jgi:hypothetical protein
MNVVTRLSAGSLENQVSIRDSGEGRLWGFPIQCFLDFVSPLVKHPEREAQYWTLQSIEV